MLPTACCCRPAPFTLHMVCSQTLYRFYSTKDGDGQWQLYFRAETGTNPGAWGPQVTVSATTGGTFVARPVAAASAQGLLLCVWEDNNALLYRVWNATAGAFITPPAQFEKGNNAGVTALPDGRFYAVYADSSNKVPRDGERRAVVRVAWHCARCCCAMCAGRVWKAVRPCRQHVGASRAGFERAGPRVHVGDAGCGWHGG